MAVTKDQVLEFLKNMSVIELADFVKELEEVFGCLLYTSDAADD